MTINEQIKEILEIHRKSVDWKKEAPTFNDYRANKIISLFQPKTTSTDIEELKEEFDAIYEGADSDIDTNLKTRKKLWELVAPHLSNKSEVKKEADIESEVIHKLLASINSFLVEKGIKDTDGTPLTFSPERIQE